MKLLAVSAYSRAFLGPAAAHELDARRRHYPKLIGAGRITRDEAEADLAAWHAIAQLFDPTIPPRNGEGDQPQAGGGGPSIPLTILAEAAARCLAGLEADLARAPDDKRAKLTARRDLAAALHERVTFEIHLRTRPQPESAAA